MAKPTERALKRKPMAVILLTTLRKDVPNVPDGQGGREFEWFETEKGMTAYFDTNVDFHKEDTKEHEDMAYLTVEIIDTKAEPMTIGRIDVQPDTEETVAWMEAVKADITTAFTPIKATTSTETDGAKKVVRPRRKSSAAAAVKGPVEKGEAPTAKAARLKERLAAKADAPKKSETGDPAPKPVVEDHPIGEAPKEIPNPPKPRAPRKPVAKKETASA